MKTRDYVEQLSKSKEPSIRNVHALMLTINDEVLHERVRQNNKWGNQKHDYGTWLTILLEELGEFCQALQASKGWGKETDAQNRLTEAIHFIAVGHAIAEQILEEEWRHTRGKSR